MAKVNKLYDENGNWVEERGRIKGAIRKAFRLHPAMQEVLKQARVELPPKTLKDGSEGKKNQVRFRCAMCGELFSSKHVQVDHQSPVVPLDRAENDIPFEEWVALIARGVFCKKDNLQVLCSTPKKLLPKGESSCHSQKSSCENFIRAEFKNNPIIGATYEAQVELFTKRYQEYLEHKEQERIRKELKKKNKKK